MRFFYSTDYNYGAGLPLTEVHGFLLDKPKQIQRGLKELLGLVDADFDEPPLVEEQALASVHDKSVLRALKSSRAVAQAAELAAIALLPTFVMRRAVVYPQIRGVAGTCAAVRAAAEGEWAVSLSGGYHHARPNLSHGFCLVNDVAMAVYELRQTGKRPRILILDLDLHQGDGNAVMFQGDDEVFTASLHEEAVFPFPKMKSDLDVGLPSRIGDAAYLEWLEGALETIRGRFEPELIIYVAGSDPYVEDPLGSLRVSRAGMLERDERVGRFALEQGASLVALPAGGYCKASPGLNAAGFAALARMAPSPWRS